MATEFPEYLQRNDDNSITVTLSRPYQVGGEECSKITLREPLTEDQDSYIPDNGASPRDTLRMMRRFACALSSVPLAPTDLDKWASRDSMRLVTALGFFGD